MQVGNWRPAACYKSGRRICDSIGPVPSQYNPPPQKKMSSGTVAIPFGQGLTPTTKAAYMNRVVDPAAMALYKRLRMKQRGVRIGTFLRDYASSLPSPVMKPLTVYVRHGDRNLKFDDVRSDDAQWCDRLKDKIGAAVGATAALDLVVPGAGARATAATLDNSNASYQLLARSANYRVQIRENTAATRRVGNDLAPLPARLSIYRSHAAVEEQRRCIEGAHQRSRRAAFDDLRRGLRDDTADAVAHAAVAREDCNEAAMNGLMNSLNARREQSRLLASLLGATDLGVLETSMCSSITAAINNENIDAAVRSHDNADVRRRTARDMVYRGFKNASSMRELGKFVASDAPKPVGNWFTNLLTGFRCYKAPAKRCLVRAPPRRMTHVHVLKVRAVKKAPPPKPDCAPAIAIGPGGCYGPAVPKVPRVVYGRAYRRRHDDDDDDDSHSSSNSDCSPYASDSDCSPHCSPHCSPRGPTVQNTFIFTDKSVHFSTSDTATTAKHYGVGDVTQQPKTDSGASNDYYGAPAIITPNTLAATAGGDSDGDSDSDGDEQDSTTQAFLMFEAVARATAPAVVTPNTLAASAAPVVVTPNTLAASAAPTVVTPNTLAASAAPTVVVVTPNTLAASAAPMVVTPNTLAASAAPMVVTPNTLAASAAPMVVTPNTLAAGAAPAVVVQTKSPAVARPAMRMMTVEDLLRGVLTEPAVAEAAAPIGCNTCGGKKAYRLNRADDDDDDDDGADDDGADDDDVYDDESGDEEDRAVNAQVSFRSSVTATRPAVAASPVKTPATHTVMVRVQQQCGQPVASVFLSDATGAQVPVAPVGAGYTRMGGVSPHTNVVVNNVKHVLPIGATHVAVTTNGHVVDTSAAHQALPADALGSKARLVLANPSTLNNTISLTRTSGDAAHTIRLTPNSTQTVMVAPGEYHFNPTAGNERVETMFVGNSYVGVVPANDTETFELLTENRHGEQKQALAARFLARPEVRAFLAAEGRSGVLFAPTDAHHAKLGAAVSLADHFCVTDARQNLETPSASDRRFYLSSEGGNHLYTLNSDKTAVLKEQRAFPLRGMWVDPANSKIAIAAFDGTPDDVVADQLVF